MKTKLAFWLGVVLAFVAVRAGPVAASGQTQIQVECVEEDGQAVGLYDVTDTFWQTNPRGTVALHARERQIARKPLRTEAIAVRTMRSGYANFTVVNRRHGLNAVYLLKQFGQKQSMQPVVVVLPIVHGGYVQRRLTVYPKVESPGPPLPNTSGSPPPAAQPPLPNTGGGNLPQTDGQWHRWLIVLGIMIGALVLLCGMRARIQREAGNDNDE